MADTDAGAFTIVEQGGDRRAIVLMGRALPYRPVTWEDEQTHERTRVAGSPQATIQVFGADAKETTIKGFWKEIFLGDESAAAAIVDGRRMESARELSTIVLDVLRKGQDLDVAWMHEARVGILGNFKRTWHNLADLEWEMTFVWEGHAVDDPGALLASSAPQSAADLSSQLDSHARDLDQKSAPLLARVGRLVVIGLDAAASVPSVLPSRALADLKDKLDEVQGGVSDFADQVVSAAQSLTSPLALALQTAATAQGIADSAGDALRLFGGRVERAAFGFLTDDVGSSVAAVEANRDAAASCRALRVQGARARAALLAQANPDLLAAFVAREGLDLRQVALRYYGDSDNWRALMTYNDLADSRLSAGQLVFVPRAAALRVAA